jgi:hypothetical protein
MPTFVWELIECREERLDLGKRNPRAGYGPCQGAVEDYDAWPEEDLMDLLELGAA